MKIMTCLAALAALLLSAAPAALASSTTMDFAVKNQGSQAVHVEVKGAGYNQVFSLQPGGQQSFSDQNTAYFMRPADYNYIVRVYRQQDNGLLCDAVVQAQNTWDFGPRVTTCRGHLWKGACQVSADKSTGACKFSITVGQ